MVRGLVGLSLLCIVKRKKDWYIKMLPAKNIPKEKEDSNEY